ncbi:hypothetical protein [Capillimicrobium parvum]|uniref:Uncharacterized protein n=1 Tax=Capillimicrobium parvum TaxID=2884022 RepID=A0A9E6Y4K8_9ACTN|nr:hypothetical protein [Capillimicrobium parvum]UGS38902.1 hypothetical protein DSM104329_05333 [Capillimicrobium parvum]
MIIVASIIGAVVFAALSSRYGAESRPFFDERPEPFPRRPNL